MPDKAWNKYLEPSALIVSLIGFGALWFSPFIVSLATAVLALYFFIQLNFWNQSDFKWVILSAVVLFLLGLLDFFLHLGDATVSAKLLLIFGLLTTLGASYSLFSRITTSEKINYFLGIIIVVTVINLIAVGGYFNHKEYYDQMLLQSKSIPIPNMHHIHFGVLNAFMIIAAAGMILKNQITSINRWVIIVCGGLILICFHILSSRTGLLAFYCGSTVTLVVYAFQHREFKVLFFGTLGLVILGIGTLSLSSSLQNKVTNSMEDINSWGKGDEINHKSMAMRLEAYKMCMYIIEHNPLGVGASDQEEVMQRAYIDNETVLYEENRVGPHNQLLEFGVKYGWIGVLAVMLFLAQWLAVLPRTQSFFWGIMVIFIVSLQFESLFERQSSIYFCMLLLPLFYHLFYKGQLNTSSDVNK